MLVCLNNQNKDIDSQIQIAISILDQQILNLNSSITSLIINDFDKHFEYTLKIEDKLDNFLENKIVFQIISIKLSKLLNTTILIDISLSINLRFRKLILSQDLAFFFFFVFIVFIVVFAISNTASTTAIFFILSIQVLSLLSTIYIFCCNVYIIIEL